MKSLFLFLFVFSFALISSAQVPGYMGKRLAFFYEPNFFLSVHNRPHVGINWRNDFGADYTVSKSVALGASVKFISTTVYDVSVIDYDNYQEFHGDIKLHGPVFSIYMKKFPFTKRGYLAPVGVYFRWELVYGKVLEKTKQLLPVTDSYYSAVLDVDEIITHNPSVYGAIFSFGRQNLFLDRMFINTGGSIGFFPSGIAYLGDGGNSYDPTRDYASIVAGRMFGYFLFNFNIGIGFLAL